MAMSPDQIEIGKTYRFSGVIRDRTVIDIIWHPAGGSGSCEYREVIAELASGARKGLRESVPLTWFAKKATATVARP